MKILITGAQGQLGQECQKVFIEKGYTLFPFSFSKLDITDFRQIHSRMAKINPDWVVNCAAITNVDYSEKIPQKVFLVNTFGPLNLALACKDLPRCKLIHISTQAVFDGRAKTPYVEEAQPTPLAIGTYAASKLAGEIIVLRALKERSLIVRTSWLFGKKGRKNFIKTIINLAEQGEALELVTDEISCPTYAYDLAHGLASLINVDAPAGIYHLTNEGFASRYDFAKAVLELTGKKDYPFKKTTLANYLAKNPRLSSVSAYSVLANTKAAKLGIRLRPWREALAAYFQEGK